MRPPTERCYYISRWRSSWTDLEFTCPIFLATGWPISAICWCPSLLWGRPSGSIAQLIHPFPLPPSPHSLFPSFQAPQSLLYTASSFTTRHTQSPLTCQILYTILPCTQITSCILLHFLVRLPEQVTHTHCFQAFIFLLLLFLPYLYSAGR